MNAHTYRHQHPRFHYSIFHVALMWIYFRYYHVIFQHQIFSFQSCLISSELDIALLVSLCGLLLHFFVRNTVSAESEMKTMITTQFALNFFVYYPYRSCWLEVVIFAYGRSLRSMTVLVWYYQVEILMMQKFLVVKLLNMHRVPAAFSLSGR